MARFEGHASIRRVFVNTDGLAVLDIKPTGQDWQWAHAPSGRSREALAIALAAMTGGWKLYVAQPDDANSIVLELVGLVKDPDVG